MGSKRRNDRYDDERDNGNKRPRVDQSYGKRRKNDHHEGRGRRHQKDSGLQGLDALKYFLTRIGDETSTHLPDSIQTLSQTLEQDIRSNRSKIIKFFVELVVKFPAKSEIYSTLIGLLNAYDSKVGKEFLETFLKSFKDSLRASEYEPARIIFRFLGHLVNCSVVHPGSYLKLMSSLVEEALEDEVPQARSDWFVYAVLSGVSHSGLVLHQHEEEDLEAVLDKIEGYIAQRNLTHHTFLRVWDESHSLPQEEYLVCLWMQISNLKKNHWEENHLSRVHLSFDRPLSESIQHSLPKTSFPHHRKGSSSYPMPMVVFRLFDQSSILQELFAGDGHCEKILPLAHSIERHLIEEDIRAILWNWHQEPKECCLKLMGLTVSEDIPLEYMIVEVILSELFRLPTNRHNEMSLSVILIELCKQQYLKVPQVLVQAVEILYENLEKMNPECVRRYSSWFSEHLEYFDYKWTWEDWNDALSLEPSNPKPKFIRETLQQGLRASFHERIMTAVPELFRPLCPKDPVIICKYLDRSDIQGMRTILKLKNAIETKSDNILDILNELPESPEMPHAHIDIFVQIFLVASKASLSHSIVWMAKYLPVFKELVNGPDAQEAVLTALFECWRRHPQKIFSLIEAFVKADIVDAAAVLKWILSPQIASHHITDFIFWEILHRMLETKQLCVERIRGEIRKIREKEEDEMEEEAMETLIDDLEKAEKDQRDLFLVTIQRFTSLLTETLPQHAGPEAWKWKWSSGLLQSVFYHHHKEAFKYVETWSPAVLGHPLDPSILNIFQGFIALRE